MSKPHFVRFGLLLCIAGCHAANQQQLDASVAVASSAATAPPSPDVSPAASSSASAAASAASNAPDASAPEHIADLPSYDAMQELGKRAIRKTVTFSVRDFKAIDNVTVGATVCEPTKYLDVVRLELGRLPQGTARQLTKDTRCRRIYGKVGAGGRTGSLFFVGVIAFVD